MKIFGSFLKIFFSLLYHQLARFYDFIASSVSSNHWTDWRKAVLPFIEGKEILELGFGTGHLLIELNKLGFKTIGLDESKEMGVITRAKLAEHKISPKITCGLAQNLPFKSDIFDSVVATFPSDYIINRQTILEIFRVLHASGKVIVLPVVWQGGTAPQTRILRWLFTITGQAPVLSHSLEAQFTIPFSEMGFEVKLLRKQVGQDIALIIIASKNP